MGTEGLKFPKQQMKRKRKKHKASILHEKAAGTCYLCVCLHGDYRIHRYLEEHHIFGGPARNVSEAEGLKVYLCLEHHRAGPEAVHTNATVKQILQQEAQKKFERTHSREEFMNLVGRNYLELEVDEEEMYGYTE